MNNASVLRPGAYLGHKQHRLVLPQLLSAGSQGISTVFSIIAVTLPATSWQLVLVKVSLQPFKQTMSLNNLGPHVLPKHDI